LAKGVAGHGTRPDAPPFELFDRTDPTRSDRTAVPLSVAGAALHRRFVEAVDADLDMPRALAVIREALKAGLVAEELRWLVLDADAILGLGLERTWDGPGDGALLPTDSEGLPRPVQDLVEARSVARAVRDFGRADALRAELQALGYEVVDQPGGSLLRRLSD
jgi:cysteinyl-tRNA synthetase